MTALSFSDATRWGIGIVAALVIQTFAIGWYLASLDAQVRSNSEEIDALKSGATVYLTRAQLEDILGGRDQRLLNIESSVGRIEKKLDTYFK
jgi:hypothetical protein